MKNILCAVCLITSVICMSRADAAIIEIGNLNVINQPGNPSHGLRYLDVSLSGGLDREAAIIEARTMYSNARLASPSEFDDYFSAFNFSYRYSYRPSDAFETGFGFSFDPYDLGATSVVDLLGSTLDINYGGGVYNIWTDPDGDAGFDTTPDLITIYNDVLTPNIQVFQYDGIFPNENSGWLIVSAVPEPTSCLLAIWGLVFICSIRRRAPNSW